MNKKNRILTGFILLTIAIGGYLIYNSMFPFAAPIAYPSQDEIKSYTLSMNDGETTTQLETTLNEVFHYIEKAIPTRKTSVNDTPSITPYYEITITTDDRLYTYYIYEDNTTTYIELPYEGIYKTDTQILDVLH